MIAYLIISRTDFHCLDTGNIHNTHLWHKKSCFFCSCAHVFWLTMLSVLPTHEFSQKLCDIDVTFDMKVDTTGLLICLFLAGLFHGQALVAMFHAAVLTENIAKRHLLGHYFG